MLFLLPCYGHGQNGCHLKLIDAYSYQQIAVDKSFVLNRRSTVDTSGSLIKISRLHGKKLQITSPDYEDFERKISLKKYRNDTLVIQLKPKASLVQMRFQSLWLSPAITTDTLHFADAKAVEKHVLSYLNYLAFLTDDCDNGMCNYSNTYRYEVYFVEEYSVFRIEKVIKLQPRSYSCEEFDKYLQKLPAIFPKFQLDDKTVQPQLSFWIGPS